MCITVKLTWYNGRDTFFSYQVYNVNEPMRAQTCYVMTRWRHEPFPRETSIALRPCAGKAGVAKRSWWCLGIIPSNRCCQFSMISQNFGRNPPLIEGRTSFANHLFILHTAAHADHRVTIPILHVKYRAQFLLGVGWCGMSYWVYVTLSWHNWKRNGFRYSGAYLLY